jgi:hypothetical protein
MFVSAMGRSIKIKEKNSNTGNLHRKTVFSTRECGSSNTRTRAQRFCEEQQVFCACSKLVQVVMATLGIQSALSLRRLAARCCFSTNATKAPAPPSGSFANGIAGIAVLGTGFLGVFQVILSVSKEFYFSLRCAL